jgi:adenosylmethionine-8-amino-7-oxononanoate aminotransferase
MVVASKVITAGFFPMGAIILSEEMTKRIEKACAPIEEVPHGFTTGSHPVGCAIAMAALDEIEAGAYQNLQSVSPLFQERLHALADHPMVGEARGVGLMGALEMVESKRTKQAFDGALGVSERVAQEALKNGLICRPLGQSIVLAPPFIIRPAEIEELFAILKKTLDAVYAGLQAKAA